MMTAAHLIELRQRLQITIQLLEQQTIGLKQDLKAVEELIAQSPTATETTQATAPPDDSPQKEAIETPRTTPIEPEIVASQLEIDTIKTLERMRQKIYAKEALSNLYEQIADANQTTPNQQPGKTESETVKNVQLDPADEALFERKIQEIKKKDALEELKKKMGLNR